MKIIKTLSIVLICFVVSCSETDSNKKTLIWTSGQLGGGWYIMASGMAKIIMEKNPDIVIKVVPGGAITNPAIIHKGLSEIGMGLDVYTSLAYNGKGAYLGKPSKNISMIGMSFSDTYMHFLRGNSAKLSFEEIFKEGTDVNMGLNKAGSSGERMFRRIMNFYDTDYEQLKEDRNFKLNLVNYAEISAQYKDRQIDYAFVNLGLPGAAVIDMTLGRQGQLLSLPKNLIDKLHSEMGMSTGVIPANTYKNQTEDLLTTKMGTLIMVQASEDEDLVYRMTKAICESEQKLTGIHASMRSFSCKTATHNAPVPIHPGALKYYEEMGYLEND